MNDMSIGKHNSISVQEPIRGVLCGTLNAPHGDLNFIEGAWDWRQKKNECCSVLFCFLWYGCLRLYEVGPRKPPLPWIVEEIHIVYVSSSVLLIQRTLLDTLSLYIEFPSVHFSNILNNKFSKTKIFTIHLRACQNNHVKKLKVKYA